MSAPRRRHSSSTAAGARIITMFDNVVDPPTHAPCKMNMSICEFICSPPSL